MDFPNKEHHRGSFLSTVSVGEVILSTSVLSFSKGCSVLLSFFWDLWVWLLAQKSVRLNFLGAFFPPENWIMCHPSALLLSPIGTNSSGPPAPTSIPQNWGRKDQWKEQEQNPFLAQGLIIQLWSIITCTYLNYRKSTTIIYYRVITRKLYRLGQNSLH